MGCWRAVAVMGVALSLARGPLVRADSAATIGPLRPPNRGEQRPGRPEQAPTAPTTMTPARAPGADQAQAAHGPPGFPAPPAPSRSDTPAGSWNPWDHPDEIADERHEGFLFRVNFGLGTGQLWAQGGPTSGRGVHYSGVDVGGALSIGGTVLDNFSVHADYFFVSVVDASASGGVYDEADYDYSYEGDLGIHVLGVGATYHWMPWNLFASLAFGAGTAVWERVDSQRQTSRLGPAAQILVGKEWWVEGQWGMGLAAQMVLFTASDPHFRRVRGGGLNLVFSATYN